MTLETIDWIIIAIYLVGCIAAGVWMKRYVRGVTDFAVAGREMDLNLGIASLAATELGIVTVMYTAQMGFTKGMAGAIPGVLFCLAMLVVGITGFVIMPLRNAGVITIPELFEKRFGNGVRWLAGLVVVVGGVLNMGIFLRLGGEFLVHVTGLDSRYLEATMTVLLVIVLIYTVLGGMLSVLVTDYIQFLVMGLGIVVTSVIVIWNVGWLDLISGLWQAHQSGATLVEVSTTGGTPDKNLTMADPFNPFASIGWDWIAWQSLVMIAGVTTWQPMIARVLSAKNSQVARKVYRRSCFFFVGRFALPGLWGAAAFLYFYSIGGLPEGVTSLTAMPTYLKTIVPTGIIGLLIAAMLAAEMSTDSGYLLTWATVIYNDLVTPCLRRPLSATANLLTVRSLVVAIGVFLMLYGLWYEIPGTAWDYLTLTGTIFEAGVFTLLVAALYWRHANRWGAFAALVLGAVAPLTSVFVNSDGVERIPAAVAGLSGFGMAFAGMIVGSFVGRRWGKGTGPICRDGPEGASHKLDLSPFPIDEENKQ